jgi:MFS family permease
MTVRAPTGWTAVGLVLSTAICIGVTLGLFPALLAINLDARGFDTSLNGLLAAMHGLSGLIVGLFVPSLFARLGAMKLYVASVLLAAAMACLFAFSDSLAAWFVIRFVMGAGLGMQWIVSETLMNQVAQGPRRGMIISLYVVVLGVGLSIGPLILTLVGTQGLLPFACVAALLLLSCLPLAFLRSVRQENPADGKPMGLYAAFLRCPSAMLAGAADGFVFQAFMALLPIYFLRLGTEQNAALGILNAFAIGATVTQLLIGLLLDRFSTDKVVIAASLLLWLGLLISFEGIGPLTGWLFVAVMGGPAAVLYTAGLAGVNDAFTAEEMASGTAAFTVIWHMGGLSGPALVGLAMQIWDPYGFLIAIAAALAVLILANLRTLSRRRRSGDAAIF